MGGKTRRLHADELFQIIFTQAADGIFVADNQGRYIDVNPCGCEMLGYARQEILKLSVRDLIPTEDLSNDPLKLDDLQAGKTIVRERFLRRKDGTLLPVEVSAKLLSNGSLLGIVRNISERKRAEHLLAALNRSAEAMADALAPDEVCSAVSSQLKEAGIFCVVLPLDKSENFYIPRYLSIAPELLQRLEKLTGIKHEDFSIPIDALDAFMQARLENRAVFVENTESLVRQVLPRPLKRLASQIVKTLRTPKFIATPMIADGNFYGIFAAQSGDLTERDLPTITAFAHQVAMSLRKAELFQQAQNEIAERKRAEETMRESEEQYHFLFENMLDGFAYCRMIFDEQNQPLDFIYLGVNNSFERLTGLRDVVGKKVTEVIPGIRKSNPELFENYGNVALTGKPEKFETYLEALDIWFSISVYSPKKEYFVAVFENITESKRVEQALRNNEKRFHALIENGLDNISLLAADGSLLWESPATIRTLDYKPDEFIGRNIFELMHPGDLDSTEKRYAELIREPGSRQSNSFRLRHADGTWRWIEAIATNMLNDPSVQAVVVNYRDVTERVRAEEEVKNSEARYRHLFDNNPHPMLVYDLKTLMFLAVNDAAIKKYGYTREEFASMTVAEIRPKEDLPRFMEHLVRQRTALEYSTGWRHRLKDGTIIDVEISSHTLDFDGREAALVLAQDVTERKKAEVRIRHITRLYATLSEVNQTIVRIKQRDELFEAICKVAVEFGKFHMAWIGLLEEGTGDIHPTAHAGYEEGYLRSIQVNINDDLRGKPLAGVAVHTGKVVFVDDIRTDPRTEFWRDQALKRNYHSMASVPLRLKGNVIGVLNLYAREEGFFSGEELQLLEEIGTDISFSLDAIETEAQRKRAEEASLESERRYRRTLSNMMEGCQIIDHDWRYIYINDAAAQQGRHTPDELLMHTMMEMYPGIEETELFGVLQVCMEERRPHRMENNFVFPDGTNGWFELSIQPVPEGLFILSMDITDRKKAEDHLRASEDRYRDLVENSRELICTHDLEGKILSANSWAVKMLEAEREADLIGKNIADFIVPEYRPEFKNYLGAIQGEGRAQGIMRVQKASGERRIWEYNNSLRTEGISTPIVRGMAIDVTESRQAEARLEASEEKYRSLFNNVPDGVYRTTVDGDLLAANPALVHMLGYDSVEELQKVNIRDLYVDPNERLGSVNLISKENEIHNLEIRLRRKDGRQIIGLDNCRAVRDGGGTLLCFEGALTDITERKRAEEEIRSRTNELSTLYDLSRAIANANDLDKILELVNRHAVKSVHTTFARIALLEGNQLVWRAAYPMRVLDHDLFVGEHMPITALPYCQHVLEQDDPAVLRSSDPEIGSEERMALLLDFIDSLCLIPLRVGDSTPNSRQVLGLLMLGEARSEEREPFTSGKVRLARNIGDQAATAINRMLLREQTERRLQHLTAMSEIDRTITSSFDLRFSLGTLLTHIIAQLNVDAADVLLFNPDPQTLEFFNGRGFRTKAIENGYPLHLGEGCAGRVALERHIVHIANLNDPSDQTSSAKNLAGEDFVSYYGIPLIAKRKVKGVLEVYHRAPFEPDEEWLHFLTTLAEQAAIAIDNLTLFNDLQRSNSELMLAYETTLEGWSRALDLRDKETEGHTQRVTEMTVKLARTVGMTESQLVNVQRGGLLHDIGKMGVPDSILLKPGELTEEEWRQMRMHPIYAYDLLSHIAYLHDVLDIPYCHHERWDGTGYPRGLKGEEIPLAARIFAIVDVWDALTSDRPYRKAWTKVKTLKYIKGLSGTHFDPLVVKVFFESKIYDVK